MSIAYHSSQRLKVEREERRWVKTNDRGKPVQKKKKMFACNCAQICKFKGIARLEEDSVVL